jgi:GAF domain-containing protein
MHLLSSGRPSDHKPNFSQSQSSFPIPPQEIARIEALYRYQVLDSQPSPEFGQIVQLAARSSGAPLALITLVDKNRQWFLAATGLEQAGIKVTEMPREIAFCAYTIMQTDLLVVEDATQDERFRVNPLVTGATRIRFYAGMPLINKNGFALGALCLLDQQPRQLSEAEAFTLQLLSRQIVDQLELGLLEHQLKQAKTALARIAHLYSHKIRLPLASLLGLLDLFDRNSLSQENHQLHDLLKETATEMDQTIHRVVYMASLMPENQSDKMPKE